MLPQTLHMVACTFTCSVRFVRMHGGCLACMPPSHCSTSCAAVLLADGFAAGAAPAGVAADAGLEADLELLVIRKVQNPSLCIGLVPTPVRAMRLSSFCITVCGRK